MYCEETDTSRLKILAGFTALVHDIGKVPTVQFISKKDGKKFTAFPFHGEMGSGVLANAWSGENDQFADLITQNEWTDICRTICVHMCGYHSIEFEGFDLKRTELLRAETDLVKHLLLRLSYGDHFGAIRKDELRDKEPHDKFLESRGIFRHLVFEPFSFKSFFNKYNYRNVVVQINGMSGDGKSTLRKEIEQIFTEQGVEFWSIERDLIICQEMAKKLNIDPITEKPPGDVYAKLYEEFDKNKKDNSRIVNEEMKKQLSSNLQKGKIVIIDTVMSLFQGISQLECPEMKKAFVISVHSIRNKLITEVDAVRMSNTIEKQIAITGKKSLFSFLPDGVNFANLTSKMTVKVESGNAFRPNIVFTLPWNGIGRTNCFRFFDEVSMTIKQIQDQTINAKNVDDVQEAIENLNLS